MAEGKPLTIDEMYAFVTIDPNDNIEGIISFKAGDTHYPCVGADMAKVDQLRNTAQFISTIAGSRVEVIKFTNREHVDWIEPG